MYNEICPNFSNVHVMRSREDFPPQPNLYFSNLSAYIFFFATHISTHTSYSSVRKTVFAKQYLNFLVVYSVINNFHSKEAKPRLLYSKYSFQCTCVGHSQSTKRAVGCLKITILRDSVTRFFGIFFA